MPLAARAGGPDRRPAEAGDRCLESASLVKLAESIFVGTGPYATGTEPRSDTDFERQAYQITV